MFSRASYPIRMAQECRVKTQRLARPWPRHKRPAGFTLIELMVTVAIVAILATIAYPNYRNYVIRAQLVDATNGLSALRANMERYFQDNRTYAAANGFSPPCLTVTTVGTFKISCPVAPVAGPPSTYQAVAVGSGSTAGFTFTVDQIPVQASAVASPAPSAWIITCTSSWVSKPGQC
jgi:prepilin-type N-terminal cleavage/methylation domain-containing protein